MRAQASLPSRVTQFRDIETSGLMRKRFDGMQAFDAAAAVMLHNERPHQDDHAADVHGRWNKERREEQKIKQWTRHVASFVRCARHEDGNARAVRCRGGYA